MHLYMFPKVSICIPAYSRVSFLRKTLESVIQQTFEDYELIITDDSPDDSVIKLLEEFRFGSKLKYFHNSPSLGSPLNWNYAVNKAQGDYIKLLHSDDYFTSSDSLKKYIDLMEKNNKAVFGFSSSIVISVAEGTERMYECSAGQLKRLMNFPEILFFANLIGSPSATVYKNGLGLEYDNHLKWLVDVDFYITLLKRNNIFAYTPEPLISTTDGAPGQITGFVMEDKNIQIREHVYVFNKLYGRSKLKESKYSIYFQLLFNKYGIKNMEDLSKITDIPDAGNSFFRKVFKKLKSGFLFTRMKVKFYNSNFNKSFFKLELF